MTAGEPHQAVNQPEIDMLLRRASECLTSAIQLLNGDKDIELQRQWLELLLGSLQHRGMYGIEERLRGAKDDDLGRAARGEAAKVIGEAASAVSQAAGLLWHPKAVRELKRASGAIGALHHRVTESVSIPVGEKIQMGEEYVSLRKFAGMLMGQGLSPKKLEGLKKAQAARRARCKEAKEQIRLAKNRGASLPPGA